MEMNTMRATKLFKTMKISTHKPTVSGQSLRGELVTDTQAIKAWKGRDNITLKTLLKEDEFTPSNCQPLRKLSTSKPWLRLEPDRETHSEHSRRPRYKLSGIWTANTTLSSSQITLQKRYYPSIPAFRHHSESLRVRVSWGWEETKQQRIGRQVMMQTDRD